jgi:hypothetical protein
MGKVVNDNLQYAKAILKMGMRSNAITEDFSDIMPEEVEASMKACSTISMGTDISEQDLSSIKELCNQVCARAACDVLRLCSIVSPLPFCCASFLSFTCSPRALRLRVVDGA